MKVFPHTTFGQTATEKSSNYSDVDFFVSAFFFCTPASDI